MDEHGQFYVVGYVGIAYQFDLTGTQFESPRPSEARDLANRPDLLPGGD